MNAFSLYQPWASLIAMGLKTGVLWTPEYTDQLVGDRIAIHASATVDPMALEVLEEVAALWPKKPGPRRAFEWWRAAPEIPRGAVICTVFAASAFEFDETFGHAVFAADTCRHGMIVTNVELVEPPDPMPGGPYIWNWEESA